jgi:hypothetical protein
MMGVDDLFTTERTEQTRPEWMGGMAAQPAKGA